MGPCTRFSLSSLSHAVTSTATRGFGPPGVPVNPNSRNRRNSHRAICVGILVGFASFRRGMRREQPSDAQVHLGAHPFRYERIRGLLDTVVDELVRTLQVLDQLQPNGIPEIRMDVLVRFPENDRKHRDLGDVAETGEPLQRGLGLVGQAGQLPDHKVHHIVSVPLGVKAIDLPAPARRVVIEAEQSLFGERRNELKGEKRIAPRRFYRDAGAQLVEFELPILAYSLGAIFAIELSSSTAYHSRNLASGAVTGFTNDVRTLVEMGRLVTGPDYLKAEQLRRVLIDDLAKVFADVDVIIWPTCPLTAWPIGEWTVGVGAQDESVLAASWRLTYPWNLAGLPAISLPCGFDSTGLPIGLQLACRPFDEMTLIRAADAYVRGHGWKDMHPKL
jgi:hypothetical protein